MMQGPTILVPLTYAKVNGPIVFADDQRARAILGEFYHPYANAWIKLIKVRAKDSLAHITRVVEANAVEGWVMRRVPGTTDVVKMEMAEIVINIELSPESGRIAKKGPILQ